LFFERLPRLLIRRRMAQGELRLWADRLRNRNHTGHVRRTLGVNEADVAIRHLGGGSGLGLLSVENRVNCNAK
jgi:hypothetical protein